MEIKVLARRGTAVREIARQTGLSRNTVRRYLRDEQVARYKQREPAAKWRDRTGFDDHALIQTDLDREVVGFGAT